MSQMSARQIDFPKTLIPMVVTFVIFSLLRPPVTRFGALTYVIARSSILLYSDGNNKYLTVT